MSAIAEIDPEQLVNVAAELPQEEFQRFLCRTAAQRSAKSGGNRASSTASRELELLEKISTGPPADAREKFQQLLYKKERESLTPDDEGEISEVIDVLENHTTKRIGWLAELAGLRGQTVEEVMQSLELTSSSHG
ncbi:MAG: hypothetical protein AAF585_29110 [Verrucomicrobiota bacterium]